MYRLLPVLLCIFVLPTPALAEEAAKEEASAKSGPVPWRGSTLSLTSLTSANSLDEGAELTYNPYSALSLTVAPRWWVNNSYFARANVSFTHEFTEADSTTYANETLVSDTNVGFGGLMGVIPVADIISFGIVDVRLPTSKPSQAASMMFAVTPTVSLIKPWRELAGLNLRLTVQATRFVHEYTTRQLDEVNSRCGAGGATCEPFVHTGVRNPRYRFVVGGGVGVFPARWFQANVGVSVIQDHLYDDIEVTSDNPFSADDGTDTRELMSYNISATFMPNANWSFTLGSQTTNPQLQPAGDYYRPFFNRFTLFTADITYSFGGVFIPQQQDEES